jgi:hypothetical protein
VNQSFYSKKILKLMVDSFLLEAGNQLETQKKLYVGRFLKGCYSKKCLVFYHFCEKISEYTILSCANLGSFFAWWMNGERFYRREFVVFRRK